MHLPGLLDTLHHVAHAHSSVASPPFERGWQLRHNPLVILLLEGDAVGVIEERECSAADSCAVEGPAHVRYNLYNSCVPRFVVCVNAPGA